MKRFLQVTRHAGRDTLPEKQWNISILTIFTMSHEGLGHPGPIGPRRQPLNCGRYIHPNHRGAVGDSHRGDALLHPWSHGAIVSRQLDGPGTQIVVGISQC